MTRSLYLIRRAERPDYHRAPYHRVILCDLKTVAEWEVGWSGDHAWLWTHDGWSKPSGGWLLCVWNGLQIDYGHVVHNLTLPDGSHAAFWRDYQDWPEGLRGVLGDATWWSVRKIPDWLRERGVSYPRDRFTQRRILEGHTGRELMHEDAGVPDHWPDPLPVHRWVYAHVGESDWKAHTLADALIERGHGYDELMQADRSKLLEMARRSLGDDLMEYLFARS